MFHSKLSGKKKLCVDSKVVVQDKTYRGDFIFSFKLDKHYFNVAQAGDKYDLRIDNRSFELWLLDERTGKLKSSENVTSNRVNKFEQSTNKNTFNNNKNYEQVPPNSRTINTGRAYNNKNKDDDFFNDNEFNFETGASNTRTKSFTVNDNNINNHYQKKVKTNEVVSDTFANFMNQFSNSGNSFGGGSRKSLNNNNYNNINNNFQKNSDDFNFQNVSNSKSQLVDINDIIGKRERSSSNNRSPYFNNKQVFKDMAVENENKNTNKNLNMDIYNHNKNALSSLNFNNLSDDNSFINSHSGGFDFNQPRKQMNMGNTGSPNINNYNNLQNSQNVNNNQVFFNDNKAFNYNADTFNPELNTSSLGNTSNLNKSQQNINNNRLNHQSVTTSPNLANPELQTKNTNTNTATTSKNTENKNMNDFKVIILIKIFIFNLIF
jgi:hypothetical protein